MEHGGRGFRLPEIPSPALRTRSKKFSQSAGNVISLQTKMFDFYDSVLKEVERLALSGQEDVAVVNSVKQITGKLLIPLVLRQKITPEMFSSKAKQLVTLMERIQSKEPIILRPPPTWVLISQIASNCHIIQGQSLFYCRCYYTVKNWASPSCVHFYHSYQGRT